MKARLIILLVLFGFSAQSQTGTAPPNFAPKTPESAAFLQHGEYPVDLSTGVTSVSIPLYTIEAGDFQLPIKMDYHASGIKVDQEATWVGLGWNLSFGAQLVLSPRGGIDEGDGQINNLPTQEAFDTFFAANPYLDSAPTGVTGMTDVDRLRDVFVFSSPTANGSFYYHNGEAIVFPPDAFKVLDGPQGSLLGGINIADAYGNTYVLGAKERSERQFSHSDYYDTAWYVTKILTAKGNMIEFNYYEDDDTFRTRSITQQIDVELFQPNCNCPNSNPFSNPEVQPMRTDEGLVTTNSKKIKEIVFNNGASKVLFTKINNREDQQFSSENGYLSEMKVMNKDNGTDFNLVKGYSFSYSYFVRAGTNDYKTRRLKLLAISSINLTQDAPYEFVYSDLTLPSKTAYSQDFYGYYNGASNANLIPSQEITNPPVTVGSANREVNSDYNPAGVLTEVHYPSKGWTKFNYETNQTYGSVPGQTGAEGCVVFGQFRGAGDRNPAPRYIDFCNSSAIFGTGVLTVKYEVIKLEGGIYTNDANHYARLNVRNSIGGFDDDGKKFGNDPPNEFTYVTEIDQSEGQYTIIGEAYGYGMILRIKSITLISERIYKNIDGPGLRIASIENFDQNNTLVLKKAYDYSEPEHPEKSSGGFVNENTFKFISNPVKHLTNKMCPTEGGGDENNLITGADVLTSYHVSSRSKYNTEGNSIVYKNVKESSISPIDSTSNGFTRYTFTTGGDWVRPDMDAAISTPWKRGKVLKKQVYKSAINKNYLLRQEVNSYVEDTSRVAYLKGFKIIWHKSIGITDEPTRHILADCGGPYATTEAFRVMFQNYPVYWNYLHRSTVAELFYDANNVLTDSLVTGKVYYYNNPNHLQLSREVVSASDGQEAETRYFYPHDPEVATQSHVMTASGLIARNMIGTPLLVKTYKGGVELSSQMTEYGEFARLSTPDPHDYNTSLLPVIVYSKKGSNPLESKIFYDYDEVGNIREYQVQNGVPVSIIWGYHKTKPVVKIENAYYNSISTGDIAAIQSASDSGDDQLLETAIQVLRNTLNKTMVSSYTYYPLVGVKTITDAKSVTTSYSYDAEGRLTAVMDGDGNILSGTQYHYKD